MAVSHRFGRKNALEFITFPLGTSGQEVTTLRLPLNDVEVTAEGAHAFTCVLRPPNTLAPADQFSSLSPAGVFAVSDGDAIPATITHSAGANQSVSKLRAFEIELVSTAADGAAAPMDLQIELTFSAGAPASHLLQLAKGGDRATYCFSAPRGRTLTDIGLSTQAWNRCEARMLAIGDYP